MSGKNLRPLRQHYMTRWPTFKIGFIITSSSFRLEDNFNKKIIVCDHYLREKRSDREFTISCI